MSDIEVDDSALTKARGAIAAARELHDTAEPDHNGLMTLQQDDEFRRLLLIASTQATIAQAEALERLVFVMEKR